MAKHFEADFKDGTTYTQGDDDASIDTEGKNAFYDILQRMDDVLVFRIVDDNGSVASVDLSTGGFTINNVSFTAHDQFYQPEAPMKLIYFKEMHQKFTPDENGGMTHLGGYVNRYFIGWETTGHDKIKTVIGIS